MGDIPNRAIEALGPFPILQGAVGLLIVLACVYAALRASRDKPVAPPPTIPAHFLMGPLHDAFENIRDLAEQGRRTNDLLERVDQSLMACKVALELIRDESRLR